MNTDLATRKQRQYTNTSLCPQLKTVGSEKNCHRQSLEASACPAKTGISNCVFITVFLKHSIDRLVPNLIWTEYTSCWIWKKIELKRCHAVSKYEVGNVAPKSPPNYRELFLSLKYQYFHCSLPITPYLDIGTVSAWIRPSKEEIARREQQHSTQTMSDSPIHQAKKEIWWGTSFAKI